MKRIHRNLLAFMLGFAAIALVADAMGADREWRLEVPVLSKHFGGVEGYEYNELNLGLGFEHTQPTHPRWYQHGGIYHNSEDRLGVYLGLGHKGYQFGPVSLGMELTLAYGYEFAPVVVAPTPVLRFTDRAKVVYIPGVMGSPHTFGLRLLF